VLVKLVRRGEEIPFAPGTVLNRGDLLGLSGSQRDVERTGKVLGYVERPSSETDVVFVGLGLLLGGLFGALPLRIGDQPLSLTASGGALVMGLVFGWLRSVRPTLGAHPGTGAVGLRHHRPGRVHWLRGHRCGPQRSKLPVLGYTVPYAIGNILLTAWGPVIVMLTR
jgi:uncharacterized transporter YbjL